MDTKVIKEIFILIILFGTLLAIINNILKLCRCYNCCKRRNQTNQIIHVQPTIIVMAESVPQDQIIQDQIIQAAIIQADIIQDQTYSNSICVNGTPVLTS